jgi:hypothetical protein
MQASRDLRRTVDDTERDALDRLAERGATNLGRHRHATSHVADEPKNLFGVARL